MRGILFVLSASAMTCLASLASSQPYGYESPAWAGYWTPLGEFDGFASRIGGVGRSSAFFHGAAHLQKMATGMALLSYREEQRDIDNGLYWQLGILVEAQCDENKWRASDLIFYDKEGHELFKRTGPRGSEPGGFQDVSAGKLSEALYKAACALPQGMS